MNDIEKAIQGLKAISEEYKKLGYIQSKELYDIAIRALEKQIPKKPMIMQLAETEYMCECGMKYWRKGGVKYCIECGQKLDWSQDDN